MEDLGIKLVKEFATTFKVHICEKQEVPAISDEARRRIVNYQIMAAELSEQLKRDAQDMLNVDPEGSMLLIRLQLIQEELAELSEAFRDRDTVSALDALVDLTYVVDGAYISLGLEGYKVPGLLEVHRSNMSKLDENGNPIISGAGRVEKSSTYTPPNLKKVLMGVS